MSNEKAEIHTGTGLLPTLLTVLFVGLKLGGVIQWSWWWVLSPVWISIVVAIIVVAIAFAIAVIGEIR